jgi:hypothetical protein
MPASKTISWTRIVLQNRRQQLVGRIAGVRILPISDNKIKQL